MNRQIAVKCPRCKRILSGSMDTPEVECICHLYCQDGSKPSDCSISVVDWDGIMNPYAGLHTNAEHEGDDVTQRWRYCSTHDKYFNKQAVIIPLDPTEFFAFQRLSDKHMRASKGEY